MTSYTSPDSLAIRVSRGIYELARPRRIAAEDAAHTVQVATNAANDCHIAVARPVAWEVDGVAVDSPIGEFGSRVTATVELLLTGRREPG